MKKSLKKLTLARETVQTLSSPGLRALAAGNGTNSDVETRCRAESGCDVICYWESINYSCPSDLIC